MKPPIDSCGDVLSLAWCDRLNILYLGCQDASILVSRILLDISRTTQSDFALCFSWFQWINLSTNKFPSPGHEASEKSPSLRLRDGPSSPSSLLSHDLTQPSHPVNTILHNSALSLRRAQSDAGSGHVNTPSTPPYTNSSRYAHHKFFDSLSQAELLKAARRRDMSQNQQSLAESPQIVRSPDARQSSDLASSRGSQYREDGIEVLFIHNQNCVSYAHFGYIYCLLLTHLNGNPYLISGCELLSSPLFFYLIVI